MNEFIRLKKEENIPLIVSYKLWEEAEKSALISMDRDTEGFDAYVKEIFMELWEAYDASSLPSRQKLSLAYVRGEITLDEYVTSVASGATDAAEDRLPVKGRTGDEEDEEILGVKPGEKQDRLGPNYEESAGVDKKDKYKDKDDGEKSGKEKNDDKRDAEKAKDKEKADKEKADKEKEKDAEDKKEESNMINSAGQETDTWFVMHYNQYESTYFYQLDPNNIFSINSDLGIAVAGKAKKQGKNIFKTAYPTPVMIDESDVPATVVAKIKKRMRMEKVDKKEETTELKEMDYPDPRVDPWGFKDVLANRLKYLAEELGDTLSMLRLPSIEDHDTARMMSIKNALNDTKAIVDSVENAIYRLDNL